MHALLHDGSECMHACAQSSQASGLVETSSPEAGHHHAKKMAGSSMETRSVKVEFQKKFNEEVTELLDLPAFQPGTASWLFLQYFQKSKLYPNGRIFIISRFTDPQNDWMFNMLSSEPF